MIRKGNVVRKWRAVAKANQEFFDVRTLSGYRTALWDPEGQHFQLPRTADDEALGEAVRRALEASRFLEPADMSALGSASEALYEQWVATSLETFAYGTRRRMFRGMLNCNIVRDREIVTLSPTRHEKLEGWSGDSFGPDDLVTLPITVSDVELGLALREAFSRCS
jgi:hypothetical protein